MMTPIVPISAGLALIFTLAAMAVGRPVLAMAAVLAGATALGAAMPASGPALFAAACAVGFAGAAVVLPPGPERRRWLIVAALGWPALIVSPPASFAAVAPVHAAQVLAVVAAAIAAAWIALAGQQTRTRYWVATLLVLLPIAADSELPVRWVGSLLLTRSDLNAAVPVEGSLAVGADVLPRLAVWLPALARLCGLIFVGLSVLRADGAQIARIWPRIAYAFAGLAVIAVGCWALGLEPSPPHHHSMAQFAGAVHLDFSALLAWLLRLAAAAALIAEPMGVAPARRDWPLPAAATLALASWLALAFAVGPAWAGGNWWADPSVFVAAAGVIAGVVALDSTWSSRSVVADVAGLAWITASWLLVAGAGSGWRVAGLWR